MALKVLMIRKKLNDANKALEALRAKDAEMQTREAEIEKSIEEAETDEERSAVEEAVNSFEEEKKEHEDAKGQLERTVADLEAELAEEEKQQDTDTPAPVEERKAEKAMVVRTNYTMRDRIEDLCKRDDVQGLIAEVRSAIKEKRAITNAGYLIPSVVLGLLKENIENYSKLYKHVFVRPVPGQGRMIIQGTIPEAVWTEMCATLNELDLSFSKVEVHR